MKKRLIIAGMGSIGLRHARLYSALPGLSVEVCDSRPQGLEEAESQTPGIRGWLEYSEALASKPDYVLVATPHPLHAGMTCDALRAGIPVLCEKPMSHHLQDAERMSSVAADCGVPLAIGFHLRFHPSVRQLRALLESKDSGALKFARYSVESLVTLENSRSRYQAHLPGALLMDYSHGLDLLLHLTERRPSKIRAMGVPGTIAGYSANPLLVSAILGYEDGFQSELHLGYTGKPEVHTLEMLTEQGTHHVELNSGKFHRNRLPDGAFDDLSVDYHRDDLYLSQWQAFMDYCEGNPSLICSDREGVEVSRLMNDLLIEMGLG